MQADWLPSAQPDWLTDAFFAQQIQPKLAALSSSLIASRLGVSRWYAGRTRQG